MNEVEKRYWELREELERAHDRYRAHRSSVNYMEEERAYSKFADYCIRVLEKLMEEHFEVLDGLEII